MTTLALDLGENLGWVLGNAVGPLQHGTIPLEGGTDLGLWLLSGGSGLSNLISWACPDDIAVEQPFLSPGGKKKDGTHKPGGYYPARKLLGLLGQVYVYARVAGIPASDVNEIPVSTGKLALSGHGNADDEMMIAAACERFGWEPHEIDGHQAHASGIFYVHIFGEAPGKRKAPRTSKGRSLLRGPGMAS